MKMFRCTVLLVIVCFCSVNCKKDHPVDTNTENRGNQEPSRLNIVLYNKPIDTIQFYLQGKWRLHYQVGGICGSCEFSREQYNEYYEFLPNRRTRYTYQDVLQIDTTYTWSSYQANPQDYIHHIIIQPYHFEAERIVNDTLVLAHPFRFNPDYMLFFLTKTN